MSGNLYKQKGSVLIGLLLVVVIIAALTYGSSFFFKENDRTPKNSVDKYIEAKKDINNINKSIEDRNDLMINQVNNATSSTDD